MGSFLNLFLFTAWVNILKPRASSLLILLLFHFRVPSKHTWRTLTSGNDWTFPSSSLQNKYDCKITPTNAVTTIPRLTQPMAHRLNFWGLMITYFEREKRLDFYFIILWLKKKMIDLSFRIFRQHPLAEVISYSTSLMACEKSWRWQRAMRLFEFCCNGSLVIDPWID